MLQPRKDRTEQLKNDIFRTSLKLFSTKGYDHTTIKDIIEAAGISNGSFFHHFGRKSGLLDMYMVSMNEQYEKFKRETLDTEPLSSSDACTRLCHFLEYCFYILTAGGIELTRAYYTSLMNEESDDFGILSHDRCLATTIIELMNEGREAGIFRADVTPEAAFDEIEYYVDGIIFDICTGRYHLLGRRDEEPRVTTQSTGQDLVKVREAAGNLVKEFVILQYVVPEKQDSYR